MRRVTTTPNLTQFKQESPFVNEWLAAVTERFNLYSGATDPVLSEIPEKQWILFRNTSTGDIKFWTRYGASVTSISGNGNLTGPAVSVADNVATFADATGQVIKDSGKQMNAAGVGLGNVTNDAQTKAAIVPNTVPTAGQILVGNAANTAYAAVSMSGDVTITSLGVATVAKINGTTPTAAIVTFLGTPSSANLAAAVTDETGTGALVFADTPTLVTPVIGAATGTSLAVTGAVTSSGGGIGYTTGAGGTVTQLTSKATGVTLNKLSGTITLNAAALASQTTVSFTFTNSFIAATDYVMVQHDSVGTLGAYTFAVTPAAGSATISVRNVHTAALSEAIVLRFAIIKAVTA